MKKFTFIIKCAIVAISCILCIYAQINKNSTTANILKDTKPVTSETCFHCMPTVKMRATIGMFDHVNYKCKSKDCRCGDRCPNIYKTAK